MRTRGLAFRVANDLLFADVIKDDVSPSEVETLILARLRQDGILRERIIHFRSPLERQEEEPYCHAVARTLVLTNDVEEVTCMRCLRTLEKSGSTRWKTQAQPLPPAAIRDKR